MIDQYREIYPQEKEIYSGQYRDIPIKDGDYPDEEDRTLTNVTSQRMYTVDLGEWTNTVFLKECKEWTPDASTINKGVSFQQTAECKREQERTRKETYVNPEGNYTVTVKNTKDVRYVDGATMTMPATGTKPFTECKFSIADKSYVYDRMVKTYSVDKPKMALTERTMTWDGRQVYWNNKVFDDYDTANYDSFPTRVSYVGFDYFIGPAKGDGYYSICRE
ncbi:hypothetical protein ACI2KR_26935 [Pseudomonas luteola]